MDSYRLQTFAKNMGAQSEYRYPLVLEEEYSFSGVHI